MGSWRPVRARALPRRQSVVDRRTRRRTHRRRAGGRADLIEERQMPASLCRPPLDVWQWLALTSVQKYVLLCW